MTLYLPLHPHSRPTPLLISQEHTRKKGKWRVVHEQPACKQKAHCIWKSEFIIFIFKDKTLNNYILSSPSFTNLIPAVLMLSTGNSLCACKTRESGTRTWVCFMFSGNFLSMQFWGWGRRSHFLFFETLTFYKQSYDIKTSKLVQISEDMLWQWIFSDKCDSCCVCNSEYGK